MVGSRRKRGPRLRVKDEGVGAYMRVDFVGRVGDAEALDGVVQVALTEAYGEVGAARYEVAVCHAEKTSRGLLAVLNLPHHHQRRAIWAALTLLASFDGSPARFTVVKHANTPEALDEGTDGEIKGADDNAMDIGE